MSRSLRKRERLLRIEQLESREYLSATPFDPSPEAMELLDLINSMRMDPQGELKRIFGENITGMVALDDRINAVINNPKTRYPSSGAALFEEWKELKPAPPLAWNPILAEVATEHSELMILYRTQEHMLPNEPSRLDRLANAGYYNKNNGDGIIERENITAYGREKPESGRGTVASYIHQYLVLDFNVPEHEHRNNVMNPNLKEVGIGLVYTTVPNFGPWVATIDFATVNPFDGPDIPDGAYLLGLVYDDANLDRHYQAGEGLADRTVTISQGDVVVGESITTLAAGAYQVYLPNGRYTVTVTGEGFETPMTKTVEIQGNNFQLDFRLQDAENQAPVIDLNGPEEGWDYHCDYLEKSDPVRLVSMNMMISDSDDEMLTYAQVTLTNRPDGLYELLDVVTTGTALSSKYDSETGILVVTGLAPVGDYVKVLKTLTYKNTSDRCDLDDRVVEIVVSDGICDSNTATTTVHVTPAKLAVVSIEDVKVIEGDDETELIFEIVLDETPRREVVIDYVITPGTAVPDRDYLSPAVTQVTIGKDETRGQIVVKIIGNYVADGDRTLTLEIVNATNVELARDAIVGTILDDDHIEDFGVTSHLERENIEFIDGRRRLYSFTAEFNGRVAWDVYMDELPTGVSLTYYVGSHAGTPLASSATFMNHQHLEFEVQEGITYVVKMEGTVSEETLPNVDRLVMVQVYKESDDWLDVAGNEDYNKFELDLENFRIGVNDSWVSYDPFRYPGIRFAYGDGGYIRVIGGGTGDTPLSVIPNGTILNIGGIDVDVSGFELFEFYGTDQNDRLYLEGTDGDDNFTFIDGNAVFQTSDGKVYQIFDIEEIVVDGKGGFDRAEIYDTEDNNTFTLRDMQMVMEGGGYHVEVLSFNHATGISFRGGMNTTYVYGEQNSMIILDQLSVQRHAEDQYYRVWNSKHVICVNSDETSNTVVMNGSRGSVIYTGDDDYMTVTDSSGSFLHEVIGFGNMFVTPKGATATVSLPDSAVIDSPSDGTTTVTMGSSRLLLVGSMTIDKRPGNTSVSSPQEVDDDLGDALPASEFVYSRTSRKVEPEDDWMAEFRRIVILETMMK